MKAFGRASGILDNYPIAGHFGYLYVNGQVFDFCDRGASVMTVMESQVIENIENEIRPTPMTSVLWVRNIVDALDGLGLNGMDLARRAGINPALFGVVESGVLVKEIVKLWELAAAESGDSTIGLRAAQGFRPSSMDATGYAMMSSPTLMAALERAVRYLGALTSASSARLIRTDAGHCLEINLMTGIIDVQRQNHEFALFGTLKFLRWIAGQDLVPTRVEFMHPKPSDTTIYVDAFGIPPIFNSTHLALSFSEDDVARVLITANAQLEPVHDQAAEQRMAQLGTARNTLMVRQLVVQSLPDGEPTRDNVAGKMGISSRTLQRRLQEEGQTFHEILDDVRHNLASRYLGNEKISLSDVANLLGFSDQSSFTRAAHRWFNESPSRIRAKLTGRDNLTK
jgi:AraC-like DNA-binding protein